MPRQKISILILCQAALCWLAAYLISKISLFGRLGIATVHKEYRLLRSGWKTFLLFFSIQVPLIILLSLIQKNFSRKLMISAATLLLILGVWGLWTTYSDFLHTYTHRLLKERFHLGFYIFWIGWMGTCIFFMVISYRKLTEPPTGTGC